jgi:hypothetical protein
MKEIHDQDNDIYELQEKEELIEDNIEINNKNDNKNKNNIIDDLSNLKIIPKEVENNKDIGEYCVNVDILKDNEAPLLSLKQTLTTKKSKTEQEEKNTLTYCFKEIPLNFLKYFTMIIIFLYFIVGIIGVIFFVKNRDERPFLFCFHFLRKDVKKNETMTYEKANKDETVIFSSDLNSFCIIHVILLFLLIMLLITILRKKENDSKNFFKNFSLFFPFTLLFNIPIFIMGILASNEKEEEKEKIYYSIIHNIFTLLSTICIMKAYIESKRHKIKNIMRVINQGFLFGLLSAYELYSLFYNICYLSTFGFEKVTNTFEIIPGTVYFIFSILILILYNDIFFPATALLIQIGLLYVKKKNSHAIVIFNICVVFFSFISLILSIMKHKKKVFNIIIEGEGELEDKKNN